MTRDSKLFDVTGNILPDYQSKYDEYARELFHGFIDLHVDISGKIFISVLGENVGEIDRKFIFILSRPLNRGVKYKILDRVIDLNQGSFSLKIEFYRKERNFQDYPLDGIKGIYSIIVHESGSPLAVYVGQSMDIGRRAKWHFADLDDGLHSNEKMQLYYNKRYNSKGNVIFEFTVNVIKRVPDEICDELSIRRWMTLEENSYLKYYIDKNELLILNAERPKLFQSKVARNEYNDELNSFDKGIKSARRIISGAIDKINKIMIDYCKLKKNDARHYDILCVLKDVRRQLKTSKMMENQKYPMMAHVRGRVPNSMRKNISLRSRKIPDWKIAIKNELTKKRIPLQLLYDLEIFENNFFD